MRHPIAVEWYAGGRADERPRRVIIGDKKHLVVRLLAESVDESLATKQQSRRYRVLTTEGLVLEIVRDADGAWWA